MYIFDVQFGGPYIKTMGHIGIYMGSLEIIEKKMESY